MSTRRRTLDRRSARRSAQRATLLVALASGLALAGCPAYNHDSYAVAEGGCASDQDGGGCVPAGVCPPNFVRVAGDPTPGIGTRDFCVARYEMKIRGSDDGAQNSAEDPAFARAHTADSRPDGTPWVHLTHVEAVLECGELGDRYTLITNAQWQTIARSIERTAANWSGGAVGAGIVNRGHSDATPLRALAAGADSDPCVGTGQTNCAEPTSPEWEQKRTFVLASGELIWDFAGNAAEHVDSAPDGPASMPLWTRYSAPPFTTETGWEAERVAFAPAGAFDALQGMGNFYGSSAAGNVVRGGPFYQGVYENLGVGGSEGRRNVGIYYADHNAYEPGGEIGFRCTYAL